MMAIRKGEELCTSHIQTRSNCQIKTKPTAHCTVHDVMFSLQKLIAKQGGRSPAINGQDHAMSSL
jgi:hypothetical protein